MKRAIFLMVLATAVFTGDCFAGRKALFVYVPPPDLAKLRQHQGVKGSGVFILHVDSKSGAVKSVNVQKSTGVAFLDQIAIETLQKWRAKPGTNPTVRVPMSFTGRYPR
jgi:TonB family protein